MSTSHGTAAELSLHSTHGRALAFADAGAARAELSNRFLKAQVGQLRSKLQKLEWVSEQLNKLPPPVRNALLAPLFSPMAASLPLEAARAIGGNATAAVTAGSYRTPASSVAGAPGFAPSPAPSPTPTRSPTHSLVHGNSVSHGASPAFRVASSGGGGGGSNSSGGGGKHAPDPLQRYLALAAKLVGRRQRLEEEQRRNERLRRQRAGLDVDDSTADGSAELDTRGDEGGTGGGRGKGAVIVVHVGDTNPEIVAALPIRHGIADRTNVSGLAKVRDWGLGI